MMHGTLAMTAVFWSMSFPDLEYSIQLEGIRQKGEAMRAISTRLKHADSGPFVEGIDFIMSTISTLVITEVNGERIVTTKICFTDATPGTR